MSSLLIKCAFAIFLTTYFVLPFSSVAPSSPVDDIRPKLSARVENYDLSAHNFVDAVAIISSRFQLPVGIEWVNTSDARVPLTMHWKDATVEEMIRDIVKTQSEYRMTVRNGVLHVHLVDGIPARENFLQVKLPRFAIADKSIEYAQGELRKLLREKISSPPPPTLPGHTGGTAGSGLSTIEQPLITVNMSNVDVQDVLDRLAAASPRPIWIVTFSDDRTLTTGGLRRTLSLWNPSPIPDREQPVWDTFHWGDKIPTALLGDK